MSAARLYPNAVKMAKALMMQVLSPGDICVDATCGNGHDTLFLAQRVAPGGIVFAFDIQQQAAEKTARLMDAHDLAKQVRIIQAGHQHIRDHVPEGVSGIMFNLGYLPGGNKEVITVPASTAAALKGAAALLKPGGLLTVVLYTGHAGGAEEALSVEAWAAQLDQRQWNVMKMTYPNRKNAPPYLIAVQKSGVR